VWSNFGRCAGAIHEPQRGRAVSSKRFEEINCGVAQALEQVADWWTLLIIRDALSAVPRHYSIRG
jgi:DNA-binding HxlR family transcriptional regulator